MAGYGKSSTALLLIFLFLPVVMLTKKTRQCKDNIVDCPCGNTGRSVSLSVQMCYNKIRDECLPCNREERYICETFAHCQTCLSNQRTCRTCAAGYYGPLCDKKSPESHRVLREQELCKVPPYLNHADFNCSLWEDRVKCEIYCVHGYTFMDTKKKKVSCNFSKGKWKPKDWQDCKPYMECDLEMKSPGSLNCSYTVGKPTVCSIECDETVDYPATDKEDYKCNWWWKPDLPHCVRKKKISIFKKKMEDSSNIY